MRRAAIVCVLAAVSILAVLAMPDSLGVVVNMLSLGDPPGSPHDGQRAPSELPPDTGVDAPPQPPVGPGSDPGGTIDPLSDLALLAAPPVAEWDMSTSPGVFEAQLVEFSGRGIMPAVLKQVLTLDSPTKMSFIFDNGSRVHRQFLLDTWYGNRGLAELDKVRTPGTVADPPSLMDDGSPAQPPGGKIRHVRDDAPAGDSEEAASLAGEVIGRRVSDDSLYDTALGAINAHRTAMGREPVKLSDNIAAQVHAQDVLEQLAISHYMSNGEKPYMTYSMTGGAGYVAQNVAFVGYDRPEQCGGYVLCTKINPSSDMLDQHNGMMFDDAHADWGHRDNILDPHHTHVSIGVAYTDYTLAFVQNFETRRIEGTIVAGKPANPISLDEAGRIKVVGRMDAGLDVHSISVYYDPLPTARTYNIHVDDMSYGAGEPIVYVFEPHPYGYISNGDPIMMADIWRVSSGSIFIEFDAPAAMADNGAYTFDIWLTDGVRPPFVGSSKTFLVGAPTD